MTKRLNIAIDPHLIALPDPCHTVEDLEGFVNGLLAWAAALDRQDIKILIAQACIDALYADDRYPYDHQLRILLTKYTVDGEVIADEDTISQVVRRLFEQTPCLEEFIGIEDILFEESETSVEPADFMTRLSHNTAQALQKSLVMLGLWHQQSGLETQTNGCTFAAGLSESVKSFHELSIQSKVIVVEPDILADVLPLMINESFHICFGHADILKLFGCFTLWGNAESEQAAVDAIQQRISELSAQGSVTTELLSFKLGSDFLKSARSCGFTQSDLAMNLIDSCARIIVQNPKNELSPFRVSEKSQAQRIRKSDGASAWRTHLTKKGAGYRLMYWKTVEGSIEFANVGSKFELEIRE